MAIADQYATQNQHFQYHLQCHQHNSITITLTLKQVQRLNLKLELKVILILMNHHMSWRHQTNFELHSIIFTKDCSYIAYAFKLFFKYSLDFSIYWAVCAMINHPITKITSKWIPWPQIGLKKCLNNILFQKIFLSCSAAILDFLAVKSFPWTLKRGVGVHFA